MITSNLPVATCGQHTDTRDLCMTTRDPRVSVRDPRMIIVVIFLTIYGSLATKCTVTDSIACGLRLSPYCYPFFFSDRYAENVLPLLAIAQKKLVERADEHGGISINQPDIVTATETGEPIGVTISITNYGDIEASVHIDPRGHDMYSNENNALQLFSVPTDRSKTLEMLKQAADQKHCAAKALQHSRQLLIRYLAGLCK